LFALEDMRQEGKLDLIGLSNVNQTKVQHALEFVDVASRSGVVAGSLRADAADSGLKLGRAP
jgi:hypothetical protein